MIRALAWWGTKRSTSDTSAPFAFSAARAASSIDRTAVLNTSFPFAILIFTRFSSRTFWLIGWREPPPGMMSCFPFDPSAYRCVERIRESPVVRCTKAAPAPSAKRTHVARSLQSTPFERVSPPEQGGFPRRPVGGMAAEEKKKKKNPRRGGGEREAPRL